MNDNIIILGAGSSFQAGIPLMGGFVEKMWEFAVRGANGKEKLSSEDINIFNNAIKVRNELDGYHGRARFDDRNIEDILSILSFNVIGGKRSDAKKLNWIIKAIARTIELSCNVKHTGKLDRIENTGQTIYNNFWYLLFEFGKNGNQIPAIITFNYDLVLERSLLHLLINSIYNNIKKPFFWPGIRLKYYYEKLTDFAFIVKYINYNGPDYKTIYGTTIEQSNLNNNNLLPIELLKLHGSLNFPAKQESNLNSQSLVSMVEEPYILPPIFNKLTSNNSRGIWKIALERLRKAKNISIVGYSLPRTDIYMQYFLKAALGPNLNLNKIFVFDPVLFKDDELSDDMKKRYEECFSPQLRNRIDFRPGWNKGIEINPAMGTFSHFISMLNKNILF